MASGSRPYHHGNLRPALISAAIGELEESGPAAMSLRAVARRAGVSHAAATYHFGDRAGLLTAVAAEGYRLLAEALRGAQDTRGSFLEVGVAYVRFAVTHRAHFEVMYRPELYHREDAELGRAREAAATLLYGTGEITPERMAYGVAAWSIVHGLATLWLNGNLPAQLGDDPEEITRVVAAHLVPPRRDPALAGRRKSDAHKGSPSIGLAQNTIRDTVNAVIPRRSRRSDVCGLVTTTRRRSVISITADAQTRVRDPLTRSLVGRPTST